VSPLGAGRTSDGGQSTSSGERLAATTRGDVETSPRTDEPGVGWWASIRTAGARRRSRRQQARS